MSVCLLHFYLCLRERENLVSFWISVCIVSQWQIYIINVFQALKAIQDGMDDPLVRSGHRLALFLRAESICNKPNSPFKKRLKEFYHEPLAELPKVTAQLGLLNFLQYFLVSDA